MVIGEYHFEKTKGIFEISTEKKFGFERPSVVSKLNQNRHSNEWRC
jgi:hypothetical protein